MLACAGAAGCDFDGQVEQCALAELCTVEGPAPVIRYPHNGAGLGTVLGLTLTININEVEQFISRLTGSEIFNRSVYYFDSIPTDIQSGSIVLVNLGALGIAVFASVLPALRAALLHPVRALRYE